MGSSHRPRRIARPGLSIVGIVAVALTYDALSGVVWIVGAGLALMVGHLLYVTFDDSQRGPKEKRP